MIMQEHDSVLTQIVRGWNMINSDLTQLRLLMHVTYRNLQSVLRIRDVYPGSRILIFVHPGSGPKIRNKREGWKKFVVLPFFVATNITKLKIILFLGRWRKNWGSIYKELLNFLLFTEKNVIKLSKIWVWDPGSGKNPIPDPGSRGQKAPYPGSGFATLLAITPYFLFLFNMI